VELGELGAALGGLGAGELGTKLASPAANAEAPKNDAATTTTISFVFMRNSPTYAPVLPGDATARSDLRHVSSPRPALILSAVVGQLRQ
jgi:hypothetical protein